MRDLTYQIKYVLATVAVAAVIVPIFISISLAVKYNGTDELVGGFAPLFGMILSTIFVPLYFTWNIVDVVLLHRNQKKGLPDRKNTTFNLVVMGGLAFILTILLSSIFGSQILSVTEYFIVVFVLIIISLVSHRFYFNAPEDSELNEKFF